MGSISKITNKNDNNNISKDDAEDILFKSIETIEIGDRIYELAQDEFNKLVDTVNAKYTVVDDDGCVYDGSDGVEWYDDCREEFMKAIFSMCEDFFNQS